MHTEVSQDSNRRPFVSFITTAMKSSIVWTAMRWNRRTICAARWVRGFTPLIRQSLISIVGKYTILHVRGETWGVLPCLRWSISFSGRVYDTRRSCAGEPRGGNMLNLSKGRSFKCFVAWLLSALGAARQLHANVIQISNLTYPIFAAATYHPGTPKLPSF